MRRLAALLGLTYVLLSTVAAAETRTFVVENSPDGYGIEQCLSTGARCGAVVADTYCQSQSFARAASFGAVDRTEVTASVATAAGSLWYPAGPAYVAIECSR